MGKNRTVRVWVADIEWDRSKFAEVVIEKLMKDCGFSREVAIKHIASFSKKYIVLDERDYIDDLAVNDPERFFTIMANIYAEKLNRGVMPQAVQNEMMHSTG